MVGDPEHASEDQVMVSGECKEAGRLYRGRTPEEREVARRERLLEAALELFGTKGVAATQIAALSAAAGISPRDFYKSFASRGALFSALYDQLIADVANQVREALAIAPKSLEAQTKAGSKAFLDAYLDDPRVGRVICLEVAALDRELKGRPRKAMHFFAEFARRAIANADGGPPQSSEGDPLRFLAMTGAINELVIEALTSPTPPERSRLEDIVHELVLLFAQ